MPVQGQQDEPDWEAAPGEGQTLGPRTQDAHAMCYEGVLTKVSDDWGRSTEDAGTTT